MSAKIFVALSTFAEYGNGPIKLLEESNLEYYLNPLKRRVNRREIVDMGREALGIIAGVEPYDDTVLSELTALKCISRCGVGIDNIDLALAKEKGIIIRNTPDVVVQPVVELTIAMAFDLMRRTTLHTRWMVEKKWQKIAGNMLAGKTVGILGLGRIGRKVAEAFLKLGTTVIGSDIRPDETWAQQHGIGLVDTQTLLKQANILSIHISAVKDSPFILGESQISLMKKGAWVINVSRGNLVDEHALYMALQSDQLSGAALDVFPQEPYVGKLCDLDNVVLTPHIATLTEESRLQMETEAVQNLLDVI
jgi:D-3-phosphoglycerate dehydrogenase